MSDGTKIEWTDATWNVVNGCSVVSPGCKHCYAMKLAGTRLRHHPSRAGLTVQTDAGPVWNGKVSFNEKVLLDPLRWKQPRKIFVCAHGDLFHENVPDEWIDRVFAVMALCPQHIFQVLTKRPDRMREYFADGDHRAMMIGAAAGTLLDGDWIWGAGKSFRPQIEALIDWGHGVDYEGNIDRVRDELLPLPNVWLGTSVEDQKRADERIPDLLATPAAVRFLSCEPLLGEVNLNTIREEWQNSAGGRTIAYESALNGKRFDEWAGDDEPWESEGHPKIDWVIVGGESGHGARPMHPDWARLLRDQCADAGVPFFFKQWGNWAILEKAAPAISAGHNHAWPDGSIGGGHADKNGGLGTTLYLTTKTRAGRLLDGVLHDGMPG
jgi:protein gp37